MVDIQNYVWEQGDDGEVSMIYKIKETPSSELLPVDLTGYKLRMDIAVQSSGERVWTFNSDDLVGEPEADSPGNEDNEATLNADGLIYIVVPRSLSLASGAIFEEMTVGNLVFDYDVFLRKPNNTQKKILKGTITINPSVTKWI